MARITEVRLTLAAFLYGIEIDLKNVIKKFIVPFNSDLSFVQDGELQKRLLERFRKENPNLDPNTSLEDLIDFLDYGDTLVVIRKNRYFLDKVASQYLDELYQEFLLTIPIRNRVMHTRPLLGGDFANIYDFVSKLKPSSPISWSTTVETRNLIEQDPSYVLTLKYPSFSSDNKNSSIIHNLPVPDFDETGFIGRTQDVNDVKQLILSNKVVTILGDGGIGKTALALKVAYDIIDAGENCPFELVIWTTAKTTMLTAKGIEEIYTTIADYTGLINSISVTLDTGSLENSRLDTVLEYFDLFKTLLVIDNLETIHNEEVRNFIRRAQVKCHILITSRIGLGELEFPRKLNGLSETESAKLIREVAKIRNSETLMKLPNKTLVEISEKLYYNPLALKWFVNTVETGISPREVLNNKSNLLSFCLTNVYEKLGEGAISILKTIRASRKKLTTGEIIYLSNMEPLDVRKSLIELFKTTLVSREIKDVNNLEETYYYIADFARDFLSKSYHIEQEYVKSLARKLKALEDGIKEIAKYSQYNEFSINALEYESANQRISAKFLSEALSFSKVNDYSKALQKVTEAKDIDSNYSEVYRVSAFIKATQGDILSAEEDYQLGLEIAPNNLRLLFYYAQFLLFNIEDSIRALEIAQKVHELKPNHPYTSFLFARCHSQNKDYENAIKILNELLVHGNLDAKNLRVAYTDLISNHYKMGFNLLKVEIDIERAINHYKKSLALFDECYEKKFIDYKVIKNFVEALNSFIHTLPITQVKDHQEFITKKITKYQQEILMTNLCYKLISKFSDKFGSNEFDFLLNSHHAVDRKLGNIQKVRSDVHYVFIDSESGRYYANRHEFLDIKNLIDWNRIEENQLVSFEVGGNRQGECAVNVRLMK